MGLRIPQRLTNLWEWLFQGTYPAVNELLLLVLVLHCIRRGLIAVTTSLEVFRGQDAFEPWALGARSLGWATGFPEWLVLSHPFNQLVGAVVAISGLCWLLKWFLPLSPVICAYSYGLLISLFESRGVFHHSPLPGVAIMTIFAAFYVLRNKQIAAALRELRFWRTPVYPNWVYALILVYLGLFYTTSGISKIVIGGSDVFRGLGLQMLIYTISLKRGVSPPVLGQILLESRSLAAIAMTTAVLLEVGALPAFFIRRLRSLWALALAGMHIGIYLTLTIDFRTNVLWLLWLGLPWSWWIQRMPATSPFVVRQDDLIPSRVVPVWKSLLARSLHSIDVLNLFSTQCRKWAGFTT